MRAQTGALCDSKRSRGHSTPGYRKEVGALTKTLLKNMPFLIVLLLDFALMIRPIVSDVKNLRALKAVYLLQSKALY